MHNPKISLIAALSENGVIGKTGRLPWYIPEDLKRFRSLTTGHAVVMGRKTFESIGRTLPNRMNIIVSRNVLFKAENALTTTDLETALELAKKYEKREIFIIGGGQIYKETIPYADRLYLTLVHKDIQGDTYFPDYSQFTRVISSEDKDNGKYKYTFLVLEKTL